MPEENNHLGQVIDLLVEVKADTAHIPVIMADVSALKDWRVEVDAERNQKAGASAMRRGFFGALFVSVGWVASHASGMFGGK